MSRLIVCQDCGQTRPHRARGLCAEDYFTRRRAGTLGERPPLGSAADGGVSTEELARLAGVSYRQLDNWIRRGWASPENALPGCGYVRGWPVSEQQVVLMMARLVTAGFTPEVASRVARAGGCVELAPGVRVEVSPVDVEQREAVMVP